MQLLCEEDSRKNGHIRPWSWSGSTTGLYEEIKEADMVEGSDPGEK